MYFKEALVKDKYECIREHVEEMEEVQEHILELQDKVKQLQAQQCVAIANWVLEHGEACRPDREAVPPVDWNDFDDKYSGAALA